VSVPRVEQTSVSLVPPAQGGMRRAVRRAVPLIAAMATILLAVGLVFSWRMGRSIAWSDTVLAVLPLMLALGCGSYGARFLRWHVLVRRLAPQLPLRTSLGIYMAGFAMGLTPGRVGEFMKFTLLRDATGVAEMESFSIFPVERATEAATFLGLAIVGALFGHLHLQHVGIGSLATIAVLPCLAAAALALRFLYRKQTRTAGAAVPTRFDGVLRGLLTVAGLRALIPALGLAAMARCFDAALFLSAAHAVGLTLTLPGSAMAWGLAGLVGGLSLLPAGVGAVEASLVTTVIGLGGDGAAALAAALLSRIMTLWLWVPPGLWLAFRGARVAAPPAEVPATVLDDERRPAPVSTGR
jgi:glycosyltransferase 2 family protein